VNATAESTETTIAPPLGVGTRLRAARERMGWALPDVAATLRIREPLLRAIEAGDAAELPALTYAVGFVRSYATLLGLDPDEIARRYRAELGGEHRHTDLQFPAPVTERGMPAGAVVLLGAVIAIGAYVGWYRFSGERPGPVPIAAVPDRLLRPVTPPPAPAAEPAVPPATAAPTPQSPPPAVISPPAGTAAGAATAPAVQASAAPALAVPSLPTPSAGPTAAPPASSPPSSSPPSSSPPSSSPLAPSPRLAETTPPAGATSPPPALPETAPGDSRITVRARADAWVEVRDRHGHILLNRTLHSGETWTVPAQAEGAEQLLLTTGNAGGTELLVDGTLAPPLGSAGMVRRDLPLDPEVIRSGKWPPANPRPRSSSAAQ
jgi:cytoskeleton protein RodZ